MLKPKRFKGAKGGRGSGKSHVMAEMLVEEHVINPDQQTVCIREIQKSLKFSAKKLIEDKIKSLGVGHLFDITLTEIRRIGGEGIIIFQGMQDHTADSIKSLEGFDRAVIEEAQSLSARSFELLIPTIRKDGSEIWCIWNPDQPDDPVEKLFNDYADDAICIHVNYTENPWCPVVIKQQAERMREIDYEKYQHVYLGGFNTKNDAQVFKGRWRVDEFEPKPEWGAPLYGIDFGFSTDPTVFVRCWIYGDVLYIDQDAGRTELDLSDTAEYILRHDKNAAHHVIYADSARPESISFLRHNGLPNIQGVKKWAGSVKDGVEFIKSFREIVIHSRCEAMQEEARLYSYKMDKRTGDILPDIEDKDNHRWDAVRYALSKLIKRQEIIFEGL